METHSYRYRNCNISTFGGTVTSVTASGIDLSGLLREGVKITAGHNFQIIQTLI